MFVSFGCLVYSAVSFSCLSSLKGCMCKHVSMLSPLPSVFLLRRSGTAPLGISTASLVLLYVMVLCWASAERAGNAMVGVEGLPKQEGTSPSAAGCMGCCVWELKRFATKEGVLPPLSWERSAEALFASPEGHYTLLKNICCCCKVINFDESKEAELKFCKTQGFGSSPFLSFPEIHSSHYLTEDPVDIHILAELWRVM